MKAPVSRTMITFDEAQELILARAQPTARTADRLITEAVGFVLAEPIVSNLSMPPFNKAAMDGFAFRHTDAVPGAALRIVGTVAAGVAAPLRLSAGECAAIMTGAPVPADADTVVPVEETSVGEMGPGTSELVGSTVTLSAVPERGRHIAPRGEDIRPGDAALAPGCLIHPQEVAILATLGRRTVRVYDAPSIAYGATGTELVAPGRPLGPGQIYNSNASTLGSQLGSYGARPHDLGVIGDDAADLRAKIAAGLEHDFLVLSGGVSMGRYDLVPDMLRELGVEIVFHKLRVKPAKPTLFGLSGKTMVFGLPGNPVSTLYACDLYVAPAIRAFRSHPHPAPRRYAGTLTAPYAKRTKRMLLLPCRSEWHADGYRLTPRGTHGSADIFRISGTDALAIVPAAARDLAAGDRVRFHKLYEDTF